MSTPRFCGEHWLIDHDARLFLFGESAPDDLGNIMQEVTEDYCLLSQQLQRMGSGAHINSLIVTPTTARALWKMSFLLFHHLIKAKEQDGYILIERFHALDGSLPLYIVRDTEHQHFEFGVWNFPGEGHVRLRGQSQPF